MRKILIGLLFGLFSSLALAFPKGDVDKWFVFAANGYFDTPEEACIDFKNDTCSASPSSSVCQYIFTGLSDYSGAKKCLFTYNGDGPLNPFNAHLESIKSCPVNSTVEGDGCACNAGYFEVGGVCKKRESACEFGTVKNVVIPLGWSDDEDSVIANGASHVGQKVCLNGCEVGLNTIKDVFTRPGEKVAGQSQPVYGEYSGVTTGAECDQNTDFPQPDKPDEGSSGGSGGAGGDGGDGGDGGNGGDHEPYPGEGDDGGGDSNDPGEAGVNHPGGANNQPNAEATCGVPGKPECTSRIDETGTPTGPGDKMSTEPIGAEFDKLRDQLNRITDKGDKDTSWGVNPSWFASGACEPWNLGEIHGQALNINYCPAVPYAQGAASFAWIVVTFFAVVHLVGAALNVRAA